MFGVPFGYWPDYSFGWGYPYFGYPYYGYPYYPAYSYPRAGSRGYMYDGSEQACPSANGQPLYLIKLTYQDNLWFATDYWYTAGTLNFVTLQGEQKKTPISSIDRDLTLQLNASCGLNFQLPN